MVSEVAERQPDEVAERQPEDASAGARDGAGTSGVEGGERVDQLIGGFIRKRYGVSLRDVYSSMRARLLTDVEHVPCNLCGTDAPVTLAHTDKYGLGITTVMCRQCGLMYLNPRPTETSYGKFYTDGSSEEGDYHTTLSLGTIEAQLKRHFGSQFEMKEEDREALRAFNRRKYTELAPGSPEPEPSDDEIATLLESRARDRENWEFEAYADNLYAYLKPDVPEGGKVFEAGAGWGKLLEPWRDRHGCEVTGLEPRAATVQAAMDHLGIELFQGFPATADIPENTYDVVMNIRTINHMLDPLGDLRHAWRWLKQGGILFIDISDAIREAHYEGFENNVVEIDHTYMFSVNTLSALVEKAGFVVERKDIVDTRHVLHGDAEAQELKQIRIVARKSEQQVEIHWPDPMQELATLLQGELYHERVTQGALRGQVRNTQRGLMAKLTAMKSKLTAMKRMRGRDVKKLKKKLVAARAPRSTKSIAANWLGLARSGSSSLKKRLWRRVR